MRPGCTVSNDHVKLPITFKFLTIFDQNSYGGLRIWGIWSHFRTCKYLIIREVFPDRKLQSPCLNAAELNNKRLDQTEQVHFHCKVDHHTRGG